MVETGFHYEQAHQLPNKERVNVKQSLITDATENKQTNC
jgi:hypothetical protein